MKTRRSRKTTGLWRKRRQARKTRKRRPGCYPERRLPRGCYPEGGVGDKGCYPAIFRR